MSPMNIGGMLMGATFIISGFYFLQTMGSGILKIMSMCLMGLGAYIVWIYHVQDNYMVNV